MKQNKKSPVMKSMQKCNDPMKLLFNVFERCMEGIIITDADGVILMINPAFTRITGYTADEAVGQKPSLLKSGHHDKKYYKDMWDTILTKGEWRGEIWNRRKNGEAYFQGLSIKKVEDINGSAVHFLGIFFDLTDLQQSRKELQYHTTHDALTGLPNRQLFIDRIERAVSNARRNREMMSVLYLDLINLKSINTSFGHHLGDIFLWEISKAIKGLCREEDTLARMGGSEFAFILPRNTDGYGASVVCRKILKLFEKPFVFDDNEFFIGACIGITVYPNDGDTMEELMKNAVLALSDAKRQGKNTFAMFIPKMDATVKRRTKLVASLYKALEKNEFEVYYQPKVDTTSERTIGAEALVRWNSAQHGMISPDEFIPLAEETGVIFSLGEWVMRTACKQIKKWQDNGHQDISIAVNLSAKQFNDKNLIRVIKSVLKDTKLDSSHLNVEITENMVMENVEAAIAIMHGMAELGISISIDDFGTGYSSLNYLKQFPVSELKIDRSFVKEIPGNNDDVAITRAIISLAHSLNLKVVAEGVETKEQLQFMQRYCCEEIQGYYFSKPMPVDEFEKYLKERVTKLLK